MTGDNIVSLLPGNSRPRSQRAPPWSFVMKSPTGWEMLRLPPAFPTLPPTMQLVTPQMLWQVTAARAQIQKTIAQVMGNEISFH